MNIIVTGIDSDSGKTVISAGLASVMQSLGYKAGVYKPVQTCAIDKGSYFVSPDLALVKMLNSYTTTHATYMMKSKSLPVIASEIEHINIDLEDIIRDYHILANKTDVLITETTGGLMTPLKNNIFNYHIPLALKIPIVFIVTPGTNSLNNYLNEINTAKTAGVEINGVIINKYQVYSENPEIKAFPTLVERYSDVKVLGLIRNFKGKSVQENILFNEILKGIDIEDVFKMEIPKLHL